jgi:neutral trehalase
MRYIAILHALRDAEWDTEAQIEASPFAVEDLVLTALTTRAAADLVAVAPELDLDAGDLEAIEKTTAAALRAAWRDDNGWFHAFDVKTERWLDTRTASGLLPLWARAATPEQVEQLARRLDAWRGEVRFGIPTTDPQARAFDPIRYWRGPVWVIVNWMVADGLTAYGHHDRARALRDETRQRVAKEGFREYYDPRSGDGIGGEGFSWSAALTLAWLTA